MKPAEQTRYEYDHAGGLFVLVLAVSSMVVVMVQGAESNIRA
jgi:hypothetical protein